MTEDPRQLFVAPGYGDIVSAMEIQGDIRVQFANGDQVDISPDLLGVSGPASVAPDAPDFATALVLFDGDGERHEIDWMAVRALTDDVFAARLRERDEAEARAVGLRLRALREDAGLAKATVAKNADMPASRLTRIECGDVDVRVSTLRTLLDAIGASFADIAGPDVPEESFRMISKKAEAHGLSLEALDRIRRGAGRKNFTRVVRDWIGWNPVADEWVAAAVPAGIRFKSLEQPDLAKVAPMVRLAKATSAVAAAAFEAPVKALPANASQLRAAISATGDLSLENIVRFLWAQGVMVLPLPRSKAFTAAAWKIDSRPVIVVQDNRSAWPFWLFDLAHEVGHLALGHVDSEGVVDVDVLKPDASEGGDEQAATSFAIELLLGRPESLVEEVRRQSEGPDAHRKFKFAVQRVAKDANVSAAMLGFVAAYALKDIAESKDRWGSATNLAKEELDRPGAEVLKDAVRTQLAFDRLSTEHAALLMELSGR